MSDKSKAEYKKQEEHAKEETKSVTKPYPLYY